jgi:hypothetical protein
VKHRKRTVQRLRPEQVNIESEAKYIVRRAVERDARLVTLGPLILFATETGDAWMLDPGDGLALCLARDGEAQSVQITETKTRFAIEWTCTYQIQGGDFIVIDQLGRTRTIVGYPTEEILKASRGRRRN